MIHRICVLTFLLLITTTFALAEGYSGGPTAQPANKRMAIQAPDDRAMIVYCEGQVKIDGKLADIGAVIANGAVVTTGVNAIAEIVFSTKNIIRIGPKTIIKLELGTLARTAELQQGSFGGVFRKLDKLAGGSFTLKTPQSVAGVRGTSFFSMVDPAKKETYVCICNGTIALSESDGGNAISKSAPHHDALIYSGTIGSETVAAPPSGYDHGHNDAGLESLAARIGERIDWTKIDEQ